jgi:galactokinase
MFITRKNRGRRVDKTGWRGRIAGLYASGEAGLERQLARYDRLVETHRGMFAPSTAGLFNVPGRTELIGNHTDHNRGRVLAAAVNLDSIAAASAAAAGRITVVSAGYERPFVVDLDQLHPQKSEAGTTTALIRGIAAGLVRHDRRVGGFDATIQSDVLPGSGLSSSASIEVLIGTIFNHLFNRGKIGALEMAKVARFSENEYFGKPCGLMDQVACACGGILHIDFRDPDSPAIEKLAGDLAPRGCVLAVVNTGAGHVDLTVDYAAVPAEMKQAAAALGKSYLADSSMAELILHEREVREKSSDRAFLRAFHFFREHERVALSVQALKDKNVARFLELLGDSGRSSFCFLQNITPPGDGRFQPLALALALSEHFIAQCGQGACRVHGGGFAGTILAVIRAADFPGYRRMMEAVFGPGSVIELLIRDQGALFLGEA